MSEPAKPAGKKIAICDDNDDILGMLKVVLTRAGYQVSIAHGYAELVPLLRHFKPELLILDIRMPEVDGFEILERMQEQHVNMPVFLVTAHDHFMYRNLSTVVGIRDYLIKPIDINVLLEKIKAVLG